MATTHELSIAIPASPAYDVFEVANAVETFLDVTADMGFGFGVRDVFVPAGSRDEAEALELRARSFLAERGVGGAQTSVYAR